MIMGSLKTVPLRMFLIVPLGDFHIFLRLNSVTLASSGVMVAHLMPTLHFLMASAASMVTLSSVLSLFSMPRSKYWIWRSRKGRISSSLMAFQMILVISSPSSSATGLSTLIFPPYIRYYFTKDMSSILSTHLLSISDESIILLAPNFFTLFSKNVKKYNIYVIIF